MGYVMLVPYSMLTIYTFLRRRDYLLAVLLVGQPISKLMLKPFPSSPSQNIFLVIYFAIGFYALGIVRLQTRRGFKVGKVSRRRIILYVTFVVFVCASLLYTPNREYAVSKTVDFVSTSSIIILATLITLENRISLQKTMITLGNLSLIIGFVTIFVTWTHTGSILVRVGTSAASEISFRGVNLAVSIWFGRRMGISFLAMFFATLVEPTKANKIKSFLLFLFTMLSVSRGPIFSLLATFAMAIVVGLKHSSQANRIIKKVLIFALIVVPIVGFSLVTKEGFQRILDFGDANALGRLGMFRISVDLIKNNLLGYGIGSYSVLAGVGRYPHNIVLELLVELGIIGLFLFSQPFIKSMRDSIKMLYKSKKEDWAFAMFSFSVLLFAILNAQFSGDIVSNEYIWFGVFLSARLSEIIATETRLSGLEQNVVVR